ncbi:MULTISPECIES: D-alanyl-D-alanine carboxypeptidase family protein [Clostridium]|uniref:serine-type D-Ala-D-Ala carboxypeptidase n=1 Tax=Clostridium ragsdalei P11 TaxID=1353534 RepID=A0A1A6AM58_9CLOT|nr:MULTISPECIES: D-alanyl-D-alanine carboxypeptidase family protein [Clostridium]OBR91108.1 D-alanyl-D-alanine carboxypeptidase DacB precursor [Clostridium ragsdalei P11]QXE19970.1 D-alanyl-D-alanine carboxypeptidase [Clostridium sp. 001]
MKRIVTFALLFLLICSNNPYGVVHAKEMPPPVSADGAVILDAATGQLLYSKDPDTAYPPASTTKIMTALLTLENTNLNDKVIIGKNPPNVDGTRVGLCEGEQLTVKDLLYGLLLASDNDCAEALAEHIGGTMDKFVAKMNKRAKELGAKNTNFVNPTGLFDENHKTSARDLALMMRALSKHPEYSKIATTISYTIPATNKSPQPREVWNENKLIQKQSTYYYSGCLGGKTGYTVQSFHSYVSTATRNGQQLIVALIHDKNKTFFPDAVALFNFGFNNFTFTKLYQKGALVTTYNKDGLSIPLIAAYDFYYIKAKDDTNVPQVTLKDKNLMFRFFKKGDIVDEASISFEGREIGKLKLASSITHGEKQVLNSNNMQKIIMKNKYLLAVPPIIIILAVVFVLKRRVFSNK